MLLEKYLKIWNKYRCYNNNTFHVFDMISLLFNLLKKSNMMTCYLQILNKSVLKIIIILNNLNFKYINIYKCFSYERNSWKMIIKTRPGLILWNWYPWIRDIEGTNMAWQLKGIVSGRSWVQIPACHSRMQKSKLKTYWSNCSYRIGRLRNYQLIPGTRQTRNISEGSFPQPSDKAAVLGTVL
jgi:hypothetical protein